MKGILRAGFLLTIIVSRTSFAWGSHDHPAIASLGLAQVADRLSLTQPVLITPYSQFLQKVAPALGVAPTPEAFARFIMVNPKVDISAMADGEADGMRWTPLRILSVHSNDPDDGRDANIVTKPDAKYMGGPEKQAFRHMEKPPLKFSDLSNTLGFPFREVGEASLRAQIYFDLARLAWQIGEPYWAWRWLACSLHYVQDLTQPYHTTQDSSHGKLIATVVKVYLQNRCRIGIVTVAVQLVSNSHLFYEDLVTHFIRTAEEGRPGDARAIWLLDALKNDDRVRGPAKRVDEEVPGGDAAGYDSDEFADVLGFAKQVRDASNRRAADLLASVYTMSNAKLLSMYDYPQPGDYPELFLREQRDLDFLAAERRFFELTRDALRLGARATRSLVASFVGQRDKTVAADIVPHLRKMLAE